MYFPTTRLLTPPLAEPLTLDEVKAQVKVTHDADDDYLNSLTVAARRWVEVKYNRALMMQRVRTLPSCFPGSDSILLPYGQLRGLQRLSWIDAAAVQREWTVALGNLVDSSSVVRAHVNADREPAAITLAYGQSWPTETLRTVAPIEIDYWCGYGDAADVPAEIKHAMKLLIGHWYRTREAVVISDRASVESRSVPLGVDALLADYNLYLV